MDVVKLKPIKKVYIWAGDKLSLAFNKGEKGEKISETWELSFLDGNFSVIDSGDDSGRSLKEVVSAADLGKNLAKFAYFPLLIKFIDAGDNLSVQVHPDDLYALKHEHSLGKTEMWHVLDADPGCGLYIGLNRDYSSKEIQDALENKKILDCLNFYEVKPGENYFIPSGTIHAIGKGVRVLEIQQSSNITYRLYDYDRVDSLGNHRELHLSKGMEVIDLNKYKPRRFSGNYIGKCDYFESRLFSCKKEAEVITNGDSFACITFIDGQGTISGIPFVKGDTFFVPANKSVIIEGFCKFIDTRIP